MEEIEELDSSELGTKEHWDKAYGAELANFKRHGILGDVWFGDDIMMKIVRYIVKKEDIRPDSSSIVDLGCGNGALLLELAREGYRNLLGLDYSEPAILMAQTLLQSEDYDVPFKVFDLLKPLDDEGSSSLPEQDVALDKGTFDAISLSPSIPPPEARGLYFRNVLKLLKKEGTFILTSCNWTVNELAVFSQPYFNLVGSLPTPQFNFGGKSGSLISIVILTPK